MTILKPAHAVLQHGHPLAQGLVVGISLTEKAGWGWGSNVSGNNGIIAPAGGKAYDYSGYNNHGSLTNGPDWQSGHFGSSLQIGITFSTQYILLPSSSPSLDNIAGPLTYLVWVIFNRSPTTGSPACLLDGGFSLIAGYPNSNQLGVKTNAQGNWVGITTGPPLTADGLWHQLGVTISSFSIATFYIDGKAVGTTSCLTPNPYSGTRSICITTDLTQNQLIGHLDCPMIYNRALSAQDIAQLYVDPFVIFRAPPRIWEVIQGSGAPGITGTLAATDLIDTAAFAGLTGIIGSLASTEGGDVMSASGAVTWQGSLTATDSLDTASLAGLVGLTGSLTATDSIDTSSIAGSVAWYGTLAATDPADTAAIVGTVAWQGSLAAAEPADTASFLGGGVTVSGSLAATEATDAAAFAGGVIVSGVLVSNEAADVAAVIGTLAWQGALAATDPTDTAAIIGNLLIPTGALAATELPDTAAIVGGVVVTGALSATELADAAAFAGGTVNPAILSATDPTDTAAIVAVIHTEGWIPAVPGTVPTVPAGRIQIEEQPGRIVIVERAA